MRFLENPSTDPYYNMSFDEWCLSHLDSDDIVFCLWRNRPSVIIGITQVPSTEVNLEYLRERGFDLVRRSTGGGAVYHDLQNLNYSFYGPVDQCDSRIVEMMAGALRKFGVNSQVSGRNDIFAGGLKVSGYARRVWKNRALVHGTLMYDVDIDTLTKVLDTPESKLHRKGVASVRSRVGNLRQMLPFGSLEDFRAALQEYLAGGDGEIVLTESQISEIHRINDNKYSTPEWINGRFEQQ